MQNIQYLKVNLIQKCKPGTDTYMCVEFSVGKLL